MILPVTSTGSHQEPSVSLNLPNDFPYFHCLGRLRQPALQLGNHALENQFSVCAAKNRFAGAFRMRHEAGHVASVIANAGDVLQGAIRVRGIGNVSIRIAIMPQNLVVRFQVCERLLISEIAAFAVGDRHAEDFSRRNLAGERGIVREGFQEHVLAMKLQIAVANERAGQQACFGQHLETIANADNQAAIFGELFHSLHDRAETRNCAAAQIISIAETAGHEHRVGVAERTFLVPEQPGGMAEHAHAMDGVLVAVRGWKL